MTFEELPKPISIGKSVDITGMKFGELTALYRVENNKSRKSFWACHCSCGEYCIKKAETLQSGESKVCDVYKHDTLVGQKFHHLIVVKRTSEYSEHKKWKYLCLCDCGNPNFLPVWDLTLRYGHITSCGCKKGGRVDIANQRFGMLVALEPTEEREGSSVIWKCQCDCGEITYKSQKTLVSGLCHCCPKHHISIGELTIKQLLDNEKIKYVHNKSYSACRFPDSNSRAKFDFYFPNNNMFIEFDGNQHFGYTGIDWNTKEKYISTTNHDLYKNQWAWDNNIAMKRIPYNYKGKLTLERIMSDEYLITPQTHPWWYPPKNSSYPYFTIDNIDNREEVS